MNIKIKKLHPNAVIPQYLHAFDSGFDLVAVEDVVIDPGQSAKVPTGLAFAIPEGFELQVRPRSGISNKTKLRISNAPGTIDAGYRGEVCVLVDNINLPDYAIIGNSLGWMDLSKQNCDTYDVDNQVITAEYMKYLHGTYIIRAGDRIAQGVIAPVYQAQFEVVDELDETERGAGGFGSSGINHFASQK